LIRHVAEEPIQPEHERGGRYGTDPDRTAGSGS
jgi:hypothetical protein